MAVVPESYNELTKHLGQHQSPYLLLMTEKVLSNCIQWHADTQRTVGSGYHHCMLLSADTTQIPCPGRMVVNVDFIGTMRSDAQGVAKRVPVSEFAEQSMGQKGVKAITLLVGDTLAAMHSCLYPGQSARNPTKKVYGVHYRMVLMQVERR